MDQCCGNQKHGSKPWTWHCFLILVSRIFVDPFSSPSAYAPHIWLAKFKHGPTYTQASKSRPEQEIANPNRVYMQAGHEPSCTPRSMDSFLLARWRMIWLIIYILFEQCWKDNSTLPWTIFYNAVTFQNLLGRSFL